MTSACVDSAPMPLAACGQSAPTAKKRVAMATPNAPLGSRATIDQVMAGDNNRVGVAVVTRGLAALLLCLPIAAPAQDGHRQAVLRLAAVSAAIADEARALPDKGLFAVERGSRMPEGECGDFFQDLVLLRNVEVVRRLDPGFEEWRDGGRRHVRGYVVVRWRGRQELRA